MARKPTRPPQPARRTPSAHTPRANDIPDDQHDSAGSNGDMRDRVIAAFMGLLAEQPIERIGLAAIAARAGITLAELRGCFSSPLAILAAHIEETDRIVLAGIDADMADDPPRERLFDVLMRRLEV